MGMMVPGPVQAAAIVALDDDAHVKAQRDLYLERLEYFASVLTRWSGAEVPLPGGAFYLWMPAPDGPWSRSYAGCLSDQAVPSPRARATSKTVLTLR